MILKTLMRMPTPNPNFEKSIGIIRREYQDFIIPKDKNINVFNAKGVVARNGKRTGFLSAGARL
jgi:hypothetical protein